MSGIFAGLTLAATLGAGVCAAMTSCRREQGDHPMAKRLSWITVVCFGFAIVCGLIAMWSEK